jgi:hypothetical protein
MGAVVRRIAVTLLIIAALTNGLAGPWAHGHALVATSGTDEPVQTAATAMTDHAMHAGCTAASDDATPPSPHGKHSNGKGAGDALCSGALTCCGAIVLAELPVVMADRRVEGWASLPPAPAGLTPPVGERPPLLLYV